MDSINETHHKASLKHCGSKSHHFIIFGKWVENCATCGYLNPEIQNWQKAIVKSFTISNNPPSHPYLEDGRWTKRDYQRYMRSKSKSLR